MTSLPFERYSSFVVVVVVVVLQITKLILVIVVTALFETVIINHKRSFNNNLRASLPLEMFIPESGQFRANEYVES